MVVTNNKPKKPSENMEYLISEGSRVVYFGDTNFKHEIATVDEIRRRDDGSESVGLILSPSLTVFIEMKKIRPIFVDESIPNGVNLNDCCIRPFTNHEGNYMSDEAIGKAFKVDKCHLEGVMVNADDESHGNNYFIRHDCYHVVPNYKTAWVWKGTKLVHEEVLFKMFTGKHVQWESCETGELLKDKVVKNNITEGLDFGRKFIQNGGIEVIR